MTFRAAQLAFKGTMPPVIKPLSVKEMESVAFGTVFAPFMWQVKHSGGEWGAPEIKDFGPISIPPQCGALHYALQCFEGLKAYKDPKTGHVRLFRPDMNATRLNRSMTRLCFPTFDTHEFLNVLKQCTLLNKDYIPAARGYSLYIRPTAIGINENLRVGPANKCLLYTLYSPVGPYYSTGFKPVSLFVGTKHHRAWPGGTGDNKLGANYCGPIFHQLQTEKAGFQQILWLGPNDVVDEVGAMNFMVLWKNKDGQRELITAPLDGTILPGVTRDSILTLARQWGEFAVSEKRFTIHELWHALKEGRVEEIFGCGTAAVISVVKMIGFEKETMDVPVNLTEKGIAMRFLNTLEGIQYGEIPSPWSWDIEGEQK